MLRSVLDSMEEGLAAADEQGKFIIWNPAALKILGLGATNLPSRDWSAHYGLYLQDMVTPFPADQLPLVRAIRGETTTTQMFVRNPELERGTWIEVSGSPLKDKNGAVCGGVAAFRDVTQRRAAEQEIRSSTKNSKREWHNAPRNWKPPTTSWRLLPTQCRTICAPRCGTSAAFPRYCPRILARECPRKHRVT
jgi:PAS domain S-box-containing protein